MESELKDGERKVKHSKMFLLRQTNEAILRFNSQKSNWLCFQI